MIKLPQIEEEDFYIALILFIISLALIFVGLIFTGGLLGAGLCLIGLAFALPMIRIGLMMLE